MTKTVDPKSKEIVERASRFKKQDESRRSATDMHPYSADPTAELEYESWTISDASGWIEDSYQRLVEYRDTEFKNLARPAIFWPDGTSLGFGFASHMSGGAQRFYKTFEYWGFRDLTEFYSLPRDLRNQFMDEAAAYWMSLFGQKDDKLKEIVANGYSSADSNSNSNSNTSFHIADKLEDNPAIDAEYTLRAGFLYLAELIKK